MVRLNSWLVRIKEIEVQEIVDILFNKAQRKIIRNAKEFRKIGRIFQRFSANEDQIYKFLTCSDMTVEELSEQTINSKLILDAGKFLDELASRASVGSKISKHELEFLRELKKKFNKLIPD